MEFSFIQELALGFYFTSWFVALVGVLPSISWTIGRVLRQGRSEIPLFFLLGSLAIVLLGAVSYSMIPCQCYRLLDPLNIIADLKSKGDLFFFGGVVLVALVVAWLTFYPLFAEPSPKFIASIVMGWCGMGVAIWAQDAVNGETWGYGLLMIDVVGFLASGVAYLYYREEPEEEETASV